MHIQFLGANGTVTGSKYLLTADTTQVLVDCGLFQGYKALRLRNWHALPLRPEKIHAVLLTHAHIDHSGYLPLLIKNGFQGKIYCTEATRDLCAILLPDCGYLQEEEARYANRHSYSKHHPAKPLYTQKEAEDALAYFHPVPFHQSISLGKHVEASFHYAGHILGASLIRVAHKKTSLLFSGDLGRPNDPIMLPPEPPPDSDYLVIESTYGNRLHEAVDPEIELATHIRETVERNGKVLIPAFAVGRTQMILYYLYRLKAQGKIPDVPVYIDSPMATDATQIFLQNSQQHRLSRKETIDVCRTAHYVRTVDESIALDQDKNPSIIISASGMATGGRICHHILNTASNPNNTLIFCGYQAGGTRGDRIVKGETEIKVLGEIVPIRAKVVQLNSMSAHADYQDMLQWLSYLSVAPKKIFIAHGESESANALKQSIHDRFGWPCNIPDYLDRVRLI